MKALVITAFCVQLWKAREAKITATQRVMQSPVAVVCGNEAVGKSLVERAVQRRGEIAFPSYLVSWKWRAREDKWVQTRTQPASVRTSAEGKQLFNTAEAEPEFATQEGNFCQHKFQQFTAALLWDPLFMPDSKDSNRDALFWRWQLTSGRGSKQPRNGEIWADFDSTKLSFVWK